ncbi:MgtC/SapB family protein [Parasulfuritortus cantonensis]|uniref:MgtC/SapB family protein n=2 Tax=Parasulfuritortus cantonensis TaxID=2528202 RepID=A0A4R1BML2_9PROT|nr:MgtC/SapB family protein [Parasulfuritortus cantonensis]
MPLFDSPELAPLAHFLTSLAIGLLIGLERERNPSAKAGLRTFTLVAMAGTLTALLSEKTGAPWLLAAGLLVMGGMMVAAYTKDEDEEDPGTTTVAAVVLCYGLGALVWYGYSQLAVTLAILTTILLYFKAEMRGISQQISRLDLVSILQFAVLSFVILPVVPNRGFGPYQVLNPYQIWWMVVLISGLSLAGYAALRIVGQRHGALLTGLFGGIASSTATTLAFSRHGRADPGLLGIAALVILLANWMVMIRLAIEVAVVAPSLLARMLVIFGCGAAAGLVALYLTVWRRMDNRPDAPRLEVKNPTEIRAALTFGMLYAGVLVASAWLSDLAGSSGVYAVALVSGLTDVDAITLSSLRLYGLGTLAGEQAATAILLALLANIAFKAGLTLAIGGAGLARHTLPGFLSAAAGAVAGWLLV